MLFDIVFEGGGVRGVAFIGALEAFADNGHEFDRLMGTSVGGLTAALLATGHEVRSLRELIFDEENDRLTIARLVTPYPEFTPQEIANSATRQLLRELDFSFMPDLLEENADELLARLLMNHGRLQPLFSIVERMGARQDARWLAWLGEQLNRHAGGEAWAEMGLAELFRRTGRSLTVIATDISGQSMLVLNHSTAPHLPLKWAVRMTISVPYLFTPVVWRAEWGLYRRRRLEGHLIVDGALQSQFPIEYFLSDQKDILAIMGERKAGNNVLGLLLDESRPVASISQRASELERTAAAMPGVALSRLLLKTMLNYSNASAASPLESFIVRLPVMGIDPYDFDASRQQLLPAINAAYNATQDFLLGWEKIHGRYCRHSSGIMPR